MKNISSTHNLACNKKNKSLWKAQLLKLIIQMREDRTRLKFIGRKETDGLENSQIYVVEKNWMDWFS